MKQDVAIICVSLTDHASAIDVERFWYHEVKTFAPKVPIIVVETKNDIKGPETRYGYAALTRNLPGVEYLQITEGNYWIIDTIDAKKVFERAVQFVIEEEKNKVIQFF